MQPGEQETFEKLLRPHMERLYRLAYRLTGSKAEAEDLFQDVLVKAFARLDELVGIDHHASWLSRVLYNHFVDNHRRYARQRLVMVSESELPQQAIDRLPGDGTPQAAGERLDDITRLDQALATLSDEHRLIVLMHDVEGYKLEEIHEVTGVPLGTVKSRLHRARARLREILAADGTFDGR
ncbi:MAG: RNA polymerase sigma factor [Gammaproteobacteria bacterium]|nr:RNA polymerase sigma factor [Gammaproteobacteria bacterium]